MPLRPVTLVTGRRRGEFPGIRMGAALVITIVILLAGVAAVMLAVLVVRQRRRAFAAVNDEGYREVRITIDGRYDPDTIEVVQGEPVRLLFYRKEDDPCSERVIFEGIGVDRKLPAHRETTIEFVPRKSGAFIFTCHMGLYRGRLIVHPARGGKRGATNA